jgi:acid phosphatase family membrane protein YuiD
MLIHNVVFWRSMLAWTIAQTGKVIWDWVHGDFDLGRMISPGGMPSSHSALVTALALSTGRVAGFDSVLFAVAAVFSFVVMYDAAGVRRAAGEQAKAINAIWNELMTSGSIDHEQLRELLGHTPVEVFVGALIGVVVAVSR